MAIPTGYQIRCDRDPLNAQSEYRYIRPLGQGAQSKAELVLSIADNKVVVRKTPTTAEVVKVSEVVEEIWEIKVLDYLERSNLSRFPLTPRWAQYMEVKTVLVKHDQSEQAEHWPISYWEFYNGSALDGRLDPSAPPLPVALLARCSSQVCQTLEVMYQAAARPVWHCDLHEGNIWLHWDNASLLSFFIGDFGYSQIGSSHRGGDQEPLSPRDVLQLRESMRHILLASNSRMVARGAIRLGPQSNSLYQMLDRLLDNLKTVGDQIRRSVNVNEDARPPSLMGIINDATQLESIAQAVEEHIDEFDTYVSWAKQLLPTRQSLKPLTLWNPPSRVDKARQLNELAEHLVSGPCTMVPVYFLDDK
ncbi:hypothetical protein B0T22DRAFT_517136 [Podospora appendiculata]|uniref:Protein kinase domain-containing protein n=1 Tax=Podospora appendiculata TaxID=314037 RepID=A0AAE0X5D0_9PEZI|nr:hypothetical protein B0T22DRAFT_517136 [Podospora appendiculata]